MAVTTSSDARSRAAEARSLTLPPTCSSAPIRPFSAMKRLMSSSADAGGAAWAWAQAASRKRQSHRDIGRELTGSDRRSQTRFAAQVIDFYQKTTQRL